MRARLLYLLPVLVFAVIAGYFAWGLVDPERNPREVPSAMVGQPVPDFVLPAVAGLDRPGVATADLKNGRPTLVNFFASWCVPCRAEHPLLMELAAESDLHLVGINYRDAPADAVAWLDELGNPYDRVGADAKARTGIDFGVSGVPETFVIDAEGRIRYQEIGPLTEQTLEETLRPIIEELGG